MSGGVNTKSPHPLRLNLRVLATKLELGLLSEVEKNAIAILLRTLATGASADEALGVKRKASRPIGCDIEERVTRVEQLRLPVESGGMGLTNEKAIEVVAEEFGKAVSTVESDLKSERGKAVRRQLKADRKLGLPVCMPWPGIPERGDKAKLFPPRAKQK
jgi:hypothetical protein